MKKIELEIVALSSSASPNQFYAVVLGEKNSVRRLPIVIGAFEAQAIVVALEKMKPTRPLTHDLFSNVLCTFNIELKEVLIYRLEEGIFYSRLYCKSGDKTIEIDSRTSDALALAIRIDCPIYTYENILKTAGMLMDAPSSKPTIVPEESHLSSEPSKQPMNKEKLKELTIDELNKRLKIVLEKEDYMQAIAIRDELLRRQK